MSRRVVITGIGAVTPLGNGADTLHDSAVLGKSGLIGGVGRCLDFDADNPLSRREKQRMDRFCQLAVTAADEAIEQADWTDGGPVDPERVPCIIGTAIGGLITLETQIEEFRSDGVDSVSPLTVPMLMANAAAAQLQLRFGLRGEASALVAACSGGAQAIAAGVRAIRLGEADAAVVGGAEAAVTGFTQAIFTSAGALSPTGTSVPFDRKRDGFLLGEGAGVLILEAAEVADRRGATVLGQVAGFGATTDGYHITAPDPTGSTAGAAVRAALADGQVQPDQVDYINAHGTGTELNDIAESKVLHAVFGDALADIPISSSKSYIGHLLGAAGAVEAIATLQALRHRMAPPTCGLTEPDETLGQLRHLPVAQELDHSAGTRIGISNSMGFGGHNITLVLKVDES